MFIELVLEGLLSVQDAARKAGFSEQEFAKLIF